MELSAVLHELCRKASAYSVNLNGRITRSSERNPLHGGSASVYHGTLSPDSTEVAIKTFRCTVQSENADVLKHIFREVHTWSKLRHKHVVHMLGISTEFDSTVSIISEWMPLGNARDYVGNTANDPRPLLEDIASALCYLHNHVSPPGPIVHGDLKGANVLVSSNCRALLSDFGLSILNTSTFNMTVDTPCGGTLDWMASELLDCKPASKPSDVWAFGMTILELFTRSRPFQDCQSQVQVMSRISTGKLPPRPTEELTQFRLSDAWWEICTSCWTSDPLSRPAISDVIEKVKAAMINNTVKHPRPAPEDSLGPVNTLALATIPAPATPLAPADMPVSTNTIVPGDIHIPAPANPEGPLPTTKNQTTESKARTSTSADDVRSRESDTAIRQSTQHPRTISSFTHGGTPASDSTGVHIQDRTSETPPTPEFQNYERTCDDPSKEVFIAGGEPPSKEMDSGRDNHSSTTPNHTIDQQSSNGSSNQELPNTLDDEVQEDELDDLTAEDIIIVMMGPSGTGKSSFVAKATNGGDEGVGHTLFSHTSEIKVTKCIIGGSKIALVDTPSFNGAKKSDLQILESISDWLTKSYEKGTLLSGILYFHRISDNRMAGTPLKNLRVFQKLCGREAMSHVVLVTTMWDEVEESVGNERLEELEGNYWKGMIARGSTTYRYGNTLESSRHLLSQLVERKRRENHLQKQIADKNLELRQTDARRELYSHLGQTAEKRAEILARITAQRHQAGDQATADDLRKRYKSLKIEVDQTLQQRQSLKLPSVKRAAAYLRKTFR